MYPLRSLSCLCKTSAARKFHFSKGFGCVADDRIPWQSRNDNTKKEKTDTVKLAFSVYDEHCRSADYSQPVPIVVSHGLFGSRNNWHSMARALNKRTLRKIYTVDLRCHGDSPHHPRVDFHLMSEDVIWLVTEQLHLPRVALMGHSLGGATMLHAAIKRADLVECLISVDISLEKFLTSRTNLIYMDAMLASKWDPGLSLSAIRKVVDAQLAPHATSLSLRQWLLTNLVHDGQRVKWRLDLQSLRNNYERFQDGARIAGTYGGPCLYVSGADSDYVRPELHDAIWKQFLAAQFVYVPGAGHLVHSDKPGEFLEIVSNFLDTHSQIRIRDLGL